MKKLYTLALAAAVAFGATAATRTLHTTTSPIPVKSAKTFELVSKVEKSGITLNNKVFRKAVSAEQAYGTYIWKFYSVGAEKYYEGQDFQVLYDDESKESYAYADGWLIPVEVDLDAATITISPVALDEIQLNDGRTATPLVYPAVATESEESFFEPTETPLVISITDNGLSLAEELGFVVYAANPNDPTNIYGYIEGYFVNEWTRYIESEYWTTLGDATFTDGIIYSGFIDQEKNPNQPVATYPLQRSTTDPGIMRLKNAWGVYFEDGASQPLVFDISDPEYMVVPMQPTGIATQQDGALYILSRSANAQNGRVDKETFMSESAQYNIAVTGNTINIPANSVYYYFPQTAPEDLYYQGPTAKPSTIVMPEGWNAVDNIAVEGADAPVEYFNLQGVRVENPSNGLYIRRHGKNVTKVIR
ncbi:MAG: hypothetical protein J6J93_02380 [Muribaculaceae bacterium]|nr:hypothetical protein [Muribaculaceae bacterium]